MEGKQKIQSLIPKEIFDSRGNPTIEVELKTSSFSVQASVPSGASVGRYEAMELRDGGKRHKGKGVFRAMKNIEKVIAPKLKGIDVTEQKKIDQLMIELDGTKNKSQLGGNAICAVSLAVCRAGAKSKNEQLFEYIKEVSGMQLKLPISLFNIINGGAHADNDLEFQEFMIAPQKDIFSQNLKIGTEIYHQLKDVLSKEYGEPGIILGDEGGFAPPLNSAQEAIELILETAQILGYQDKIKIVLDVAASQFCQQGKYKMNTNIFATPQLTEYYSQLTSKYPILGLEDPFSENDWEGFAQITKQLGQNILIIGDDILVTNQERIRKAQAKKAVNAMIVKINQIGTVSEALEAVKLAKSFGLKTIVSHRSGETTDSFIADFAVGMGADFIKSGAPGPKERMAKYNRLLEIEEKI